MTKIYGYIRVSSRDQNEERQVRAMEEFGVPPASMICDKQSGKDFERPGYRRLIKKIKPGDTLVIKSIDRLGRDLTGTLIADIVLQLLSYVAQTEREFIKQRQREGIENARANGIHLGRKATERPDNYDAVKSAWQKGTLTGRQAALELGVSPTLFRKWIANDKENAS